MPEKPHLSLVVIGHVDHGKSTTMGHYLYLMKAIDERTMAAYEEEARKIGKSSFKFAWILDRVKEERERGLTIAPAYTKFETSKYYFTLIDAPGHRDFVKNMITGASQADAAILLVSAKKGEYETGISPGGQTREHAFLAFMLGIKQIVVLINKMDDASVNWSEERYKECKQGVSDLLKTVGYNVSKISFIPTSGWTGDNLIEKSSNMPWYDGPIITEALDAVEQPSKPIDKPLRLPIQATYTIKGIGLVPVGRVETGVLNPGDKIIIMPGKMEVEVKTIEMHHQNLPKAVPGDNIGFNIKGVEKTQITRGCVAGPLDNPPTVAKEFTAQIIVIHHPTAVAVGYTPVLHAHTAQVACKFAELISKIDPRTGQVTEKNPSFLKTGDAAIVKLEPIHPTALEAYTDFPELGRFAIRDSGITVAAGVVKEITQKA